MFALEVRLKYVRLAIPSQPVSEIFTPPFFLHLRIYIYENSRCKFLLCQNYNQKGVQRQENKLVILISKRGLKYIICQLSFLKFLGENNLVCTYFLLGVNFYYVRIIIRKAHKLKARKQISNFIERDGLDYILRI
jgi:hypothetical protein